jgi:phage shock protein A
MLEAGPERAPERLIVGREELTPIPPRPTPRVHIRPQIQRSPRSAIFSRTRDIVAANVTDLLDKAEDPAKMIRLMIVEMEETLIDVRASTARTIAEQKEMRSQIDRLQQLQASWAEKAELALSKGREDLARAALAEKEKAAELSDHLEGEIALLDSALKASELDVSRLEAKLREARGRQNAIVARLESAQHRARMREMTSGARVEEAFARFERLERRVDLAEGQADALALGMPAKTLEVELAELRIAERVEAELLAMKAARKDVA